MRRDDDERDANRTPDEVTTFKNHNFIIFIL